MQTDWSILLTRVAPLSSFGKPARCRRSLGDCYSWWKPEAEIETEKADAVVEAESIANAKAEKPKHKAKRKAKEPVAVAW